MTKSLEKALKEAAKLSDADQNALAEAIFTEIRTDKVWDEAFASSQDELDRLADEALEEHRSRRTQPLNPKKL